MKTKSLCIRFDEVDRKLLREMAAHYETTSAELVRRWAYIEIDKYKKEKESK